MVRSRVPAVVIPLSHWILVLYWQNRYGVHTYMAVMIGQLLRPVPSSRASSEGRCRKQSSGTNESSLSWSHPPSIGDWCLKCGSILF